MSWGHTNSQWNRVLLLALSCYIVVPDVILSLALPPFRGCFTTLHANNVKSQLEITSHAFLSFIPLLADPPPPHNTVTTQSLCRVAVGGGEPCGCPAISYYYRISLVQSKWVKHLLPVQGDNVSHPGEAQTHNGTPGFSCQNCLATISSFLRSKTSRQDFPGHFNFSYFLLLIY